MVKKKEKGTKEELNFKVIGKYLSDPPKYPNTLYQYELFMIMIRNKIISTTFYTLILVVSFILILYGGGSTFIGYILLFWWIWRVRFDRRKWDKLEKRLDKLEKKKK
jgi:hypothetical protein